MLQSNLLLFLESKRMEIRENRAKSDESKKSEASSKRKPLLHSSRCEHRRSSMNRTRKESLEASRKKRDRGRRLFLNNAFTLTHFAHHSLALLSHPNRERESQLFLSGNALHFSLSFVSDRSRTIPYHLLLRVYIIKPWHEHEISRYRDIEIRDREED